MLLPLLSEKRGIRGALACPSYQLPCLEEGAPGGLGREGVDLEERLGFGVGEGSLCVGWELFFNIILFTQR